MNKLKNFIKKKLISVEKEKIIIPCIQGEFLSRKTAFITGGSSGIGYSIAESFLRNGATVIIAGRNIERLQSAKERMCDSIRCDNSRIQIVKLDIVDIEYTTSKLQESLDSFGFLIDIFVNNAGINGSSIFPETTEEEYDKIMDTNLKGMYFFRKRLLNIWLNIT